MRMGFNMRDFFAWGIEGNRDALHVGHARQHECLWLPHPAGRPRHGDVVSLGHPTDVLGVDATDVPAVAAVPGNGLLGGW